MFGESVTDFPRMMTNSHSCRNTVDMAVLLSSGVNILPSFFPVSSPDNSRL